MPQWQVQHESPEPKPGNGCHTWHESMIHDNQQRFRLRWCCNSSFFRMPRKGYIPRKIRRIHKSQEPMSQNVQFQNDASNNSARCILSYTFFWTKLRDFEHVKRIIKIRVDWMLTGMSQPLSKDWFFKLGQSEWCTSEVLMVDLLKASKGPATLQKFSYYKWLKIHYSIYI